MTEQLPHQKKIEECLQEIKTRRQELVGLSDRTKVVIDDIETKILAYLQKTKNIPSMGVTSTVLESLTQLYRQFSDANTQTIRSLEKEIELTAKYLPDEEGGTGEKVSQKRLLEAMMQAQKELTELNSDVIPNSGEEDISDA